jgi:type III pantothenate kinase
MEINLLVLSAGNSRLAIGVFSGGELKYVTRIPIGQQQDWAGKLGQAWERIASTDSPTVAAASVNPKVDAVLDELIEKVAGQQIQWVGKALELPIPVKTESPERTGVDRVLNVAAAYEQMGKACVVVDAGTAITVDVCNDQGEFLGGAIAPGTAMMLDALHEKTAALPRVSLAKPEKPVANSTEESIREGVYLAARGLVKEFTETCALELGAWPDIIATGGDAELLFGGWELIHAVAPDLTLYGIALAYTNHHLKDES